MRIKTLHIEYTSDCNSRCSMCDFWNNYTNSVVDSDLIYKTIKETEGLRKVYFTGGECLTHANTLFPLIKRLHELKLDITICLITNGLLLGKYTEEVSTLFNKVLISLDSVDREIYAKIRGVDGCEMVKRGIRLLRKNNPDITINLRCLVLEHNIRNLTDIIDFAVREKINKISFIPEEISSKAAFGREATETIENHRSLSLNELSVCIDYIKKNYGGCSLFTDGFLDLDYIYSIYSGEKQQRMKCDRAYKSCVIDGKHVVSPCFFIKGKQIIDSNKSLSDILSSEEYNRLLQQIKGSDLCKACPCPRELSE